MDERELNIRVENELYRYILAISDDEMEKVTLDRIEEGILWFLLRYDGEITKPQRTLIIQKICRMFENKNKNLAARSKKDYDQKLEKIYDIEI